MAYEVGGRGGGRGFGAPRGGGFGGRGGGRGGDRGGRGAFAPSATAFRTYQLAMHAPILTLANASFARINA